ncbi:MAG: hypothetical protein JW850_01925 [Thermoflexales bacterium]|nr:hypothetical protein [Thermoflexales bacterium]
MPAGTCWLLPGTSDTFASVLPWHSHGHGDSPPIADNHPIPRGYLNTYTPFTDLTATRHLDTLADPDGHAGGHASLARHC